MHSKSSLKQQLSILKFFVLLSSLLIISLNTSGQTKEENMKNAIWRSNDPDFAVTNAGQRWKDQSAVILCKSYTYKVRKSFFNVIESIYNHYRILLLDDAAVNKFSTLSFNADRDLGFFIFSTFTSKTFIGIKIIKPDGTEKEIDIAKAAINEYKENGETQKIKKYAIPDLTPGDIIDYYYCAETEQPTGSVYAFNPVYFPLTYDYPVLKSKLKLHVMRKCYLNVKPLNGAPDLKREADSKDNDLVYSLIDTCREVSKDNIYLFEYRVNPAIVFQAYTNNALMFKNRFYFIDAEDKVKKEVSDDELREFGNNILSAKYNIKINKVARYVRKKCKKISDKKIWVKEAYNYFRQMYFFKEYDYTPLFRYNAMREYQFANSFCAILNKLKIKNSLVLASPRELGTIKDVIIANQLGYLVRIDEPKPYYISSFTPFSLFNELDPSYQNTPAKAISTQGYFEERRIYNVSIDEDNASMNKSSSTISVKFDPDNIDKIDITETDSIKGLLKKHYQNILITQEDYISACNGKYNQDYELPDAYESFSDKTKMLEQANADRLKYFKENIEDEFDIKNIEVKELKLLNAGLWDDNPLLIFKCQYLIPGLITQNGDNFIIEAGKLIGKQAFDNSQDSIRKHDIYFNYSRAFDNEISIQIPNGFEVKGMSKFNIHVSNSIGGFVSSTTIKDNILIIKTHKFYNHNFETKDKWNQVLDLLNAANNFWAQKLLFVKQ